MPAPLIPLPSFLRRVAAFIGFATGFLLLSLGVGVLGYHHIAGLGWVDSLYNSAMILTGMGPADPMPNDRAKLFATAYALFGGAIYPALTAIVLYPFLHRMLKALHLEMLAKDDE